MDIGKTLRGHKPFVFGLFFLIWANSAFFILGESIKEFILYLGFFLVFFSVVKQGFKRRDLKFFFITFCFYFAYLVIAWLKEQNTLFSLNIVFGGICFVLLNLGYILAQKKKFEINLGKSAIVFFSLLSICGAFFFYQNQAIIYQVNEVSRAQGFENLNPIGVAYTHSLLFLFLFWLQYQTDNKFYKIITYIAMVSVAFVIVSTLSRGAVLSLVSFMLLFFAKGFSLNSKSLKRVFSFSLILFFVVSMIFVLSKQLPYFQEKVNLFSRRFSSLYEFMETQSSDYSVTRRANIYQEFFNNLGSYIFGEYDYQPYPHNQFLEIIMRWGVWGLPLLIFSIWTFIKSIILLNHERLMRNPTLFLILSLFFFSYMQSMTSMSLEMNRMLWLGFGYLFGWSSVHLLKSSIKNYNL